MRLESEEEAAMKTAGFCSCVVGVNPDIPFLYLCSGPNKSSPWHRMAHNFDLEVISPFQSFSHKALLAEFEEIVAMAVRRSASADASDKKSTDDIRMHASTWVVPLPHKTHSGHCSVTPLASAPPAEQVRGSYHHQQGEHQTESTGPPMGQVTMDESFDMELTEPNQPMTHEGPSINYEHSWLHRHCPSTLIHHQRARGTGRLFSGLLAVNVTLLGAALISSVVISSMPAKNAYIFLSVLMFCSSAWAIYYLLWSRRKRYAAILQDHHAGALWLRVCLVLFGTCSLLVSVFKICYDSSLLTCKQPTDIVFSVTEIIFIMIQTSFLWLSCRDCVQVQHNLNRWGIILAMATNFLLWLLAVINDSVHREIESLQPNDTSDGVENGCLCPKFSSCFIFQRGYVTLYPFNLEYSLMCASMLFIMWRNVGRREVHHSGLSHPRFHLRGVLYGPILGAVALLVGIYIFIQYQIQASAGAVTTISFVIYFMYSIILLSVMVIACFIGIIAQTFRDKQHVKYTRHDNENGEDPDKQNKEKRQKKSKCECRHRNVEKYKDHWQSEGEAEGDKEPNGEQNKNFEDQEHIEYHTSEEEGKCEDTEKQAENEICNGHIGMQDLCKENKMDHLDINHQTKQHSTEIDAHHQEMIVRHRSPPKNYTRSLEIMLLLGAALGQFSISYYSMVAIIATGSWNLLNTLNLSYSILIILQHMFQNIFIIEGMKKEHNEHYYLQATKESKEEHNEAPRRLSMVEIRRASLAYLQDVGRLNVSRRLVKEMALFLVLCNIILWIMSAFGEHPQYTNGLEREYYGFSVWFSILNFGLPLSVFYRMHSVGGLLEVYVTS
ncbi:proton channel OTOP3-like [Hyla sarda]|uniref:proton channel OTOP3-like n=1 Tax=Hyla sarda TaxID=327740 RepID=UPI0024C42097|nr:proton channel OTOP3-like [Hyla sarda]